VSLIRIIPWRGPALHCCCFAPGAAADAATIAPRRRRGDRRVGSMSGKRSNRRSPADQTDRHLREEADPIPVWSPSPAAGRRYARMTDRSGSGRATRPKRGIRSLDAEAGRTSRCPHRGVSPRRPPEQSLGVVVVVFRRRQQHTAETDSERIAPTPSRSRGKFRVFSSGVGDDVIYVFLDRLPSVRAARPNTSSVRGEKHRAGRGYSGRQGRSPVHHRCL